MTKLADETLQHIALDFKSDTVVSTASRLLEHIQAQADEIKVLREALVSISKNTCCDTCQEAALVAIEALEATK